VEARSGRVDLYVITVAVDHRKNELCHWSYTMTNSYIEWTITFDPKPISSRSFDYDFYHQDYDGALDGDDIRCGNACSIEDAKIQIDEIEITARDKPLVQQLMK
jgi:hypothetical protein